MNKIIYLLIINFSFIKFCFPSDTLLLNEYNFPTIKIYIPDYFESELLEMNTFFDGYLVVKLSMENKDSLELFWVNSLENFDIQEKYFQTNALEIFRSKCILDYEMNIVNKLNSFIYNFYLIKKVNDQNLNNIPNRITLFNLLVWMDNKFLFEKDRFNYIIFRTSFHTKFIKNKIDNSLFLFPISEFYEFEICDEKLMNKNNFKKTNIVINSE